MSSISASDLLIKELQGDLPVVANPFLALGEKVGLTELEVIQAIDEWKRVGILRRLGAVVHHNKLGYRYNAMVAFAAEKEDCDRVGELMAASQSVSHCYWRRTPDHWPYRVFVMIHALSEEELDSEIRELAEVSGISDYKVIRSIREYKKTSVRFR